MSTLKKAQIPRTIELRGVRTHNLKGIDLDLPLHRLIVVTGTSGAGKSSLAFDTLCAEGQRRYIETFSPYTRQFLAKLDKPDADRAAGIPPTIGLGQPHARHSARSTVGTISEIHDALCLLYTHAGQVVCRNCGQIVAPASPALVAGAIEACPDGTRYDVVFPLDMPPEADGEALARSLIAEGFTRVRVNGQTVTLVDLPLGLPPDGTIGVVVDRLVRGKDPLERRIDSIETAFAKGLGRALVIAGDVSRTYNRGWRCSHCGTDHLEPQPALFRYNSPLGACPICEGLGRTMELDVDRIVPDPARTSGVFLSRWRRYQTCPACHGARLRPEALAVKIAGRDIAAFSAMTIGEARAFIAGLKALCGQPAVAKFLTQIDNRLGHLAEIAVDYLTLDRPTRTLSAGELKRVGLAKTLGSGLVNTLYVLDEPTLGLHPQEVGDLIAILRRLRDDGNTPVVVEHDHEVIAAADHVVDLGPGAGAAGGQVLYSGPVVGFKQATPSATSDYLFGRKRTEVPANRRPVTQRAIRLTGARGNNLKSIDVTFPLGLFCVVTGKSGAGKSTLVEETLYLALLHHLAREADSAAPYSELLVSGEVADVVFLDHAPLARSARSNPVTHLKAFDEIRKTFAATHEAKLRAYDAGRFSFNFEGGRCSACQGDGFLRIDMHFLADVMVRCPDCLGTRYRPEILEVTYRGKNIAEVLELTAREALGFFRHRPKVQARLRPMVDIGLDYLRLGQPVATLSGGEAQRLKLAGFLARSTAALKRNGASPHTVFLLDLPAAGLHPLDVVKLLEVLNSLVDRGHSVIAIEHSTDVIKSADWVIDLGPGGGDQGGEVVAQGTPEDVAKTGTPTGQALAKALAAIASID